MITYNLTNENFENVVKLRVCVHETFKTGPEAHARLDDIMTRLGDTTPPTPTPEPARSTHAPWTQQEIDAITCATSPTEAVRLYRGAHPDSQRTDYAVIKKYGKMPKGEPIPTPVSTGDEVTLHDPIPITSCADHAPMGPTLRKNAWLPEEDDVVREAPSSEEAARLHGVMFPGKRTPAAIDARWRKLNPTPLVKPTRAAQDPPKIGDRVRYRGKPGTIKQIDPKDGRVLILLDYNAGQVWTSPETVEMVR